MESAGTTPRVAVTAPELAALFEASGPFATVYLTTDAEIDNAAQRSELRWRSLRESLAAAGAPEATLSAIDWVVPDAHLFGQCVGVVADSEGLLHVEHHDQVPHRDVARWASLPSVVPLVEWRQASPPHVVVTADRQGADIVGFRREAPDVTRQAGGSADPLRKSAPGGWSQKRYQQRAENVWERNAEAVAAEVVKLAERLGARVIGVAGDVRAVSMLRNELPRQLADLVVVLEGDISDGIVRAVADAVARDTVSVVEKFREELGQVDRAVEGPGATLDALARSQVEMLLVPGDADDTEAVGVDELVRAAFATGAGIRVVPRHGGPAGGIGALLRWS